MLCFAQNSGKGFNYQAVIRGGDGSVLPNTNVELRFSLFAGQNATPAKWVEKHNVTTDDFGIIGVTVGKGTRISGETAFTNVDFSKSAYWLKVEINESGTLRELSFTALPSVPYAEAASNAVGIPAGTVVAFAGTAVPNGWMLCDGCSLNRSENIALFNAIGTAWGFTSSTTFNIPDMRGVFLRGVDGTKGRDADKASRTALNTGGNTGNTVGSYQRNAAPNITGSFQVDDEVKGTGSGAFSQGTATKYDATSNSSKGDGAYLNFNASRSSAVYGRDGATEVHPENVYVHYIIKY
jgi:microcystin-dependent protein